MGKPLPRPKIWRYCPFNELVCSDKYGRKLVIMLSIAASAIGSLVGAFMPEYWSFLITRSGSCYILSGNILTRTGLLDCVTFLPALNPS
jgi:MFS family permease